VLLRRAGSIIEAHDRLAPRVDRAVLDEVVGLVPSEWLTNEPGETFVRYLSARCSDGGFAEEAERARPHA
jgi:hypothetical protein